MILYEVHISYELSDFTPLLMLAFFAVFPFLWEKVAFYFPFLPKRGAASNIGIFKGDGAFANINTVKKFSRICVIISIAASLITISSYIDEYNRIFIAYKNGDYQTVEGYVENFSPMPYTGHQDETFDINGVEFVYSDYDNTVGYNTSRSHGGVITGNGQHLKIRYINYKDENIIVYIEEIKT